MTLRLRTVSRLIALSLIAAALPAHAGDLKHDFANPPDSARPRAWWHWVNGNVTKQGISADLAWMRRIGLGGVQMFDVDIGTLQYVDQRVGFMTPLWLDHVHHAVREASRLGLEVTITPTSGWSQSGGPWIKPAQGMKKYVWAETRVDGPRHYAGMLPAPPGNLGPFQNAPYVPNTFYQPPSGGSPGGKPYARPELTVTPWYADAAVVAYRLPDAEQDALPVATGSAGAFDARMLGDADVATAQALPMPPSGPAWVQLDYGKPVRAQAFTVGLGRVLFPRGVLQASDDGVAFRTLATLPGPVHEGLRGLGVRTFAFPETRARYFRLTLEKPAHGGLDQWLGFPMPAGHTVAEFALAGGARVNRFEEKAGFNMVPDYDGLATPAVAPEMAVAGASVIDLSGKMRADGSLDWEVPPGHWAIMRLGYSLTGQTNDPATPEGRGLEVDKLSAAHVRSHMAQFLAPLKKQLGPLLGPHGMSHLLLDSWEANQQNWTDDMLAQFRRRRGYDPLRWLPVLGGRVVDSAEASDRFLFDFRRTIADLLSDNHYGLITDIAHENGMKTYGEAAGVNLPTVADGLQAKGRVDIPMGEFWDRNPDQKPGNDHLADVREAASAAHIYGKNIVAAESFTAAGQPWSRSPRDLKWLADFNLAQGINRFVFHTSVHQPFDDKKPGVTLFGFGQHFTRHETWAEQAGPWVKYLSRASYMMQQGHAVNDIAVFVGEGAPAIVPFHDGLRTEIPAGYGADYVNRDVLLECATVRNGRIELPGGASYGLLVVPPAITTMSVPLLRKLRELVEGGARIVAARPQGPAGLAADTGYADLVQALWGAADGRSQGVNTPGKGKVFWGKELADVLKETGQAPDLVLDSRFVGAHRRDGATEIYFVANQKAQPEQLKASFRVHGMKPELWYADSGRTAPASYAMQDGRTVVELDLEAHGSVFVVFRHPTAQAQQHLPAAEETVAATLAGPWTLQFPGAAKPLALASLVSWSSLAEPQQRYFSGQAAYRSSLAIPADWLSGGQRVLLDLGQVDVMAQVLVNGKDAGVLWKGPYRADITALLKPGTNQLEVKVTNVWVNRLIGDAEKDGGAPSTFTTFVPYRAGAPLLSSGLIGPVRVIRRSTR